MQGYGEITSLYIKGGGVPLRLAKLVALVCPWCGKTLLTSELAWREREKEEG